MRLRQVTKKEFDTFLNYFQDREISVSIICKSTTYFDNFDSLPLAELREGKCFIYD